MGSEDEHKKLVINVLQTLDDEGLAIKWEKCTFLTHKIERLGFKIDAKGTTPLINKSDAIRNLKEPNCIKDIRSLMGSIIQFNKFIPNLASLSTPFRELTHLRTYALMQKINHLSGPQHTRKRLKKSRKKFATR